MRKLKELFKNKFDIWIFIVGVMPFIVVPVGSIVIYILAFFENNIFIEDYKTYRSLSKIKLSSNCEYISIVDFEQNNNFGIKQALKSYSETIDSCKTTIPVVEGVISWEKSYLEENARFYKYYDSNFIIIKVLCIGDYSDSVIENYLIDRKYVLYLLNK